MKSLSLENICSHNQVVKDFLQTCPQKYNQIYWILDIAIMKKTKRVSSTFNRKKWS